MILVLGLHGQVARALQQFLKEDVTFKGRETFNFERPETVIDLVQKIKPSVVVNAVAYTQVDQAENERERAQAVNALTPGILARHCAETGIYLVHYSTDYVFSGEGANSWTEGDAPDPRNWYGSTKSQGEKEIQESHCDHVILRASWVYSATGTNFVKTMLRLAREKEEVRVVNDQYGTPTSARDVAEVTWQVLQRRAQGWRPRSLYHVSGGEFTTWFHFAEEIFRQALSMGMIKSAPKVLAIPTEQYVAQAKRPLNSRMDNTLLNRDLHRTNPDWKKSLQQVLRSLHENH